MTWLPIPSSTGDALQTETVSIEVSPASGVIAATMLPGDSVSAQ